MANQQKKKKKKDTSVLTSVRQPVPLFIFARFNFFVLPKFLKPFFCPPYEKCGHRCPKHKGVPLFGKLQYCIWRRGSFSRVCSVKVSDSVSCYSDKLAHVQVVINCRYSVAQMCTHEDTLAHYLCAPFIDDVMRYTALITNINACRPGVFAGGW